MKKVIGLAGTFASGKDTAAEYLVSKHGFLHVSTGDLIREETKERGHSIHRDNLVWVANQARAARGGGTYVKEALEKFNKDGVAKGLVVSGIRHPGEVEALKAAGGMLIFIDAPVERRYEWAKGRGRLEDNTTLEGFKAQEARELAHPAEGGQSILEVRKLADAEIENAETPEQLYTEINAIIQKDD